MTTQLHKGTRRQVPQLPGGVWPRPLLLHQPLRDRLSEKSRHGRCVCLALHVTHSVQVTVLGYWGLRSEMRQTGILLALPSSQEFKPVSIFNFLANSFYSNFKKMAET